MVYQANDVDATSSGDAAERDEHARVSSREALRFLTRAGRVLSASLEPDQTLRRLMRLAIPRVACFAAIDLLREDGCLERLAHGHIDTERDRLLEEPDPFRPEDCFPLIGQALGSRESILIEDTTRNWQVDPATQQRMLDLGGRSAIVVPLLAHDRILGAITLGSTRTDRHYDRQDLSLAEELARTAALALENARLYQRAEQAISARDEVLAVVSHDLRNPVNRVRMAAELILERDDVAPETDRMAGIVIRAADEMNRLIGDLLDVTRIEAGRLSIERTPVDEDQVRARPETADLRVVVVSTESSDTRIARLRSMGAGFVRKPFTPESLRQTILEATGLCDEQLRAASASVGDGYDF